MAWPKGRPAHPKSGRPPGSKNKNTDLLAKCEAMGVDVFEELLKLSQANDIALKFGALKELASYLYPKKKAIEITLPDIPDDEFDKEVERRLNERRSSTRISER